MTARDVSITVAVPVHNRVRFLRRAVDSVLAQVREGDRVDVLVVDDASTEDVRAALAPVLDRPDRRVALVRNDRTLGLVGNWNRCLALATGEVVNILHSDEVLAEDALARVRAAFALHEGLGMVLTGHAPPDVRFPAGPEAAEMVSPGVFPVSSVFLARGAVAECGLFDPEFRYSPDEEYFARVAARRGALFLVPPLARSPAHGAHHKFRTWEEPDFLERYRAGRLRVRAYAGHTGRDLERLVEEDLIAACRFIALDSWAHGMTALGRRYHRVARDEFGLRAPKSERLLYASSFVPGGTRAARLAIELWRKLAPRSRRPCPDAGGASPPPP